MMMIIDGHAHATAEFADPKTLKEIMDELNVAKIVLCPGRGDDPSYEPKRPKVRQSLIVTNHRVLFFSNHLLRRWSKHVTDRDLGNEYIFKLRKEMPDKIIQFYWVNFLNKDFYSKMIDAYKRMKFQGIKLHQAVVPFDNGGEEIEQVAKFAGEKNLPIFIHIFNSKEANKLIKLARRYPKTNFIVAHLMGLENVIKHGKDLNNFYFDISTYFIISERRIRKAIKHFGADHVFLGSDTPMGYDNLKNNIEKIQNMDLPLEEKELILGKAIAKLLKL
ncbi:MAG: amidohydrolase family protein [Asgard group archaeon]|nr:amidohydrolase family protein [Asgard group archaeon]